MKPSGLRQPHEGHSGMTILFRRLVFIVVMSCFVCHVAQATSPGMLNGNLQVVDLSDLVEPLPLGVNSSTKILHQTQNWEHSSLGNPSWPAGGHASLGYPAVVKNDQGQNQDGKYYLYYAHHDPTSGIGSAVADSITGPYVKASVPHAIDVLGLHWTDSQVMVNPLYRPTGIPENWVGHYSSPSVVWNEDEQLWFMYFHYYNHYWGGAPLRSNGQHGEHWSTNNPGLGHQMTALATTPDLSSHDWTLWTDSVWAEVSVDDTVPVLPTTDAAWMESQSSYHAIQRLPDGRWLAFLRGTNNSSGRPTVGFGTSSDGRHWDYFPQNPVIAPGKSWTVDTTEYRPKFIGYLGGNESGEDEYLVAWGEGSHPQIIYGTTTDFKTFERDPRGYANWGIGDDGIVSARREGNQLYLFSGQYVNVMELDVAPDQLLGDANGDGIVAITDLGILGANFNRTGLGYNMGDFNNDGIVDIADLGILGANWGSTAQMSGAVLKTSVPEPTALSLFVMGVLAVSCRLR